ncbi:MULTISPECIES: hypothetical protein [unclassified Lentimonas]|uniref:hypothetical protein n=2 Tax=unclassified Lentimonas TaxID=2630993 RepID=UPI0013243F22|nr:Unannotated [Lentimonas sp. CC4]CAA6683465.1 Unannotated [Lentimonas sp. CC6]CAA6691271.1 Unannotated [Lentimonas sp. CC10]CAA6695897.1 Unannotated [Lentimonas sp. CC19]CAA7068659.1 Unannotated [Lentimonas sp. CC11]CAA7171645.1 Unannotated [Lentimonas sp. CC21]CAA7181431.1 Unannotated [Lentimonas sp. CC8]
MKNKLSTAISILALLAFAFLSCSYITSDPSFTKWMNGSEYQKNFDLKYKEGYFPIVVEAKSSLTGAIVFRACYVPFPKYPSEAFWFYSNHGVSTENFENRHRDLKKDGYFLAYHQSFEPSPGHCIHQATWIKSKK